MFLKNFYKGELDALDEAEGIRKRVMPSVRGQYDELQEIRGNTIDQITRQLFIHPLDFVHNITNNSLEVVPPASHIQMVNMLLDKQGTDPAKYEEIERMLIRYTAVEMSVQPFIRSKVKQMLYKNGYLVTQPTEDGKKTLDVLHNNYRVKRLNEKLEDLKNANTPGEADNGKGDIILEVISI